MTSVTNSMLSLSSRFVMMIIVIIITCLFQTGSCDGFGDRVAQVSCKHSHFPYGLDPKKDILTYRRSDQVNRPINQSELIHQRPEKKRHIVWESRCFPVTFPRRRQSPIALTFYRVARIN